MSAGSSTPSPVRAGRVRLVSKLWSTAERQVSEVETRLAHLSEDPAALEREAKTLAIIARTVRDLVAIDTERLSHAKKKDAPDDNEPRSLDAFRASLAARLAELGGAGNGASPS